MSQKNIAPLERRVSGKLEQRGIEPHPGLPRGYMSFSQISKYLKCAKQYQFHYLEDAPFNGSDALALGKAVHAAVEYAHERQILGEEIELAELLNTARNAAKDQVFMHGWSADAADSLIGLQRGAEACTLAWWQNFGSGCDAIATEEEFIHMFEGPDGEDVPMLGYVDLRHRRKDGVEEVLDYKTTGRAKPQSWVNENLQLWIYSIITGIDDVGIASIVRPKGPIANFTSGCEAQLVIRRTKVTELQKHHARNIIKDVVRGISLGFFPRCAPGEWNCTPKWCDHFEQCRGSHQDTLTPPSTK